MPEDKHEEIAKLAYAIWESRGGGDGGAEQDWFEAERRLQEQQQTEPDQEYSQVAA